MREYQKGDLLTITIEDMDAEGQGIGKADGYTLFVKDALVGDEVKVKIMKAKKSFAFARLEEVVTPSPYRVAPVCEHHRRCGGCQLQCLSYEAQLDFKQNKVRNNLIRIGGLEAETVDACMEPIIGMEEPFHYRNKAQFPVGTDKEGNPVAGFYAQRTHAIIPNTDCGLGVTENREILELILSFMKESAIPAYDEETGRGVVRHILIRKGFESGELMVCIVINRDSFKGEDELAKRLMQIPGMASVTVSINKERTNVIMGTKIRLLAGKPTITDTLGGISFEISPLSFYQVNPVQTVKLYGKAVEYANLTGKESVWDLYCGIGTISLFMAGKAGKVYGVEIIPEAIEDARRNAERNGFANTEFYVGKAEEVLPEFYENAAAQGKEDMLHPDVIVVDPPRKGCDEACLDTMLKMQPERIVYVSCDSATLARDLKVLCAGGYTLKKVCCVDMFGHTVHVETVVLLSQQKPDDYIEIEIKLDEIDTTSAEAKATYKEIEEWVQEHYGFHVTNLNIAQVKQKHGIIERENYNKPKSENSRQPGCPKEKVRAIEEALRNFKMI